MSDTSTMSLTATPKSMHKEMTQVQFVLAGFPVTPKTMSADDTEYTLLLEKLEIEEQLGQRMNITVPFNHSVVLSSQQYELDVCIKYSTKYEQYTFTLLKPKDYVSDMQDFAEVVLRYQKDRINIDYFHVFANGSPLHPKVTPDELSALKGIGKRLLYFSLRHMAHLEPIQSTTVLSLCAGGVMSKWTGLEQYIAMNTTQLLERIKDDRGCLSEVFWYMARGLCGGTLTYPEKDYVTAVEDHLISKGLDVYYTAVYGILANNPHSIQHDLLARIVCCFEESRSLVSYYCRTYGFVYTNTTGNTMKSTYGEVMNMEP